MAYLTNVIQGKDPYRPLQKRIHIDVTSLTKISMDIKYAPSSIKQYKYILVVLC